jgi:hypothetical protein
MVKKTMNKGKESSMSRTCLVFISVLAGLFVEAGSLHAEVPNAVLSATARSPQERIYAYLCAPNKNQKTLRQLMKDASSDPRSVTVQQATQPLLNCRERPQISPQDVRLWIGAPQRLVVYFVRENSNGRAVVPIKEAKMQQVSIVLSGEEMIFNGIESQVQNNLPFAIIKITNKHYAKGTHGSLVEVRIKYGPNTTVTTPWYFYKTDKMSFYQLFGREIGLWFPVLMFSTGFQPSSDGIPFAAFPVGVAFGGRLNFKSREFNYLGLSGFASWLIHPETGKDSEDTPNNAPSGFNLASLAPGLLLDAAGWGYIGYAYGLDFREDKTDPGHLLVLGAGPKLIEVFNSTKKD